MESELNDLEKTLNVLIIDDEFMILEIASEILTYLGHKAWTAESGTQGIKLFKEKHTFSKA